MKQREITITLNVKAIQNYKRTDERGRGQWLPILILNKGVFIMSFQIKVKGKELDIKFNYRLMYQANRELSQVDEQGNNAGNGAAQLFMQITEQQDEAVHDLLRLSWKGPGKLSEDDRIEAISEYVEEYGYETLFETLEQELLDSGFFVAKIKKWMKDMERGAKLLENKDSEEAKVQAEAIREMIDSNKKKLSL